MSSSDLAVIVGRNVRSARRAADLTQSELATRVGVTSLMAVSRWETGAHKPSDAFLVRLSEVLGHDPAWFFTDHSDQRAAA
jgi:transcriptional regulator with XRE-family HTH domain